MFSGSFSVCKGTSSIKPGATFILFLAEWFVCSLKLRNKKFLPIPLPKITSKGSPVSSHILTLAA